MNNSCRICNSFSSLSLPVGKYADFFKLRANFGNDPFIFSASAEAKPTGGSASYLVNMVRAVRRVILAASRVAGNPQTFDRTFCHFCLNCNALTPAHAFSYEDLQGLYDDYRSEKYNRDRISVEPSYEAISKRVGDDSVERQNRNCSVEVFLEPHLTKMASQAALDLGGSDGRFIPDGVIKKFSIIEIVDTSDSSVHHTVDKNKVIKISKAAKGKYTFLMCMHVLEHVGSPRDFILDAMPYLVPGGFLYIEVPLEMDEQIKCLFNERRFNLNDPIILHEHINKFDDFSIEFLIKSIPGLTLIGSEAASLDSGWMTSRVGRYLAQLAE